MNEECLICKAPLEYIETDELMECELCHKKQSSKTRCVKGHFVFLLLLNYTLIFNKKQGVPKNALFVAD